MTKNLRRFLFCFLIFLSLGASKTAFANHILGVDLGYTWVNVDTYKVTLTVFGDCGGTNFNTLATSAPTICVYNGNTSVTTLTLAIEAPSAGTEITPVCTADLGMTTCTSTTLTIPGVKKFVYSALYKVPSASANWRFVFNGNMGGGVYAGRASSINNTTGGVTVIQVIDTLNNTTAHNSSPDLTVIPTPYYCLNNDDNYNPGAIDPDGDSLHFALVAGKVGQNTASCTLSGTTVAYATGYSASAPLHSNTGTFVFDPATGQIQFNPDVTQRSLVVYNVEEYRAGVLVGTSQREMTFLVQTCTNTPANGPISSASSGTIIDSTHYEKCQNTGAFTFHVKPTEANPANNIKITASSLPAGSTFTVVNDSTNAPDGTFSWTSTGTAPGTYTFYLYFVDDNCPIAGTNSVAYNVTIQPTPVITAPTYTVCAASTITLSDNVTGGTWSTTATAIATVAASTGVVTGTNSGTTAANAVITYTSPAGCTTTATVTVNPQPAVITGNTTVCAGFTTNLSDVTAGGVWSSATTTVATIGTSTGVVTGILGTNTSVITYKITTTGCARTTTVTVNAPPGTIVGTRTVCVGSTTTLSDTPTGGTWTSSTTTQATVNSSGVVTGVASGSPVISYTSGVGCTTTATVTVNATPNPIAPTTATICIGTTASLSDTSPGGTWSSTNTAVATVAGGTVTGVASGTAVISYTNSSGCASTATATVNSTPTAITPASPVVCTGGTLQLSDGVSGGAWSSSVTTFATVSAGAGLVTGIAAGAETITYSIGSCTRTTTLTVNPSPDAGTISGAANLCTGGTPVQLSDNSVGGVWSSGNITVATITAGGLVYGASAGTVVISYSVTNSCGTAVATYSMTISSTAGAGAIVGPTTICAGTFTTLSETVSGGAWNATNGSATISGTGLLTGVSAGVDTIMYSIVNTCGSYTATKVITIGAYLTAGTITGPTSVCSGSAITLSDATAGGAWSSTNVSVATISGVGVVHGVSGGSTVISYLVTSACGSVAATYSVTVNPTTSAGTIAGTSTICAGTFTILSDAVGGGIWSSTNTGVATVTGVGLVTGVSAGITVISYTFNTICGTVAATQTMTVNPAPAVSPISGPAAVCAGTSANFSDVVTGGIWSVTNSHAVIFGSGLLTGVSAGADTIVYTYTNSCGTINTTLPITISPVPTVGAVSGPTSVCVSSLISLSDPTPGGAWSSSNGHATITTGGVVTGISPGVDTISYSIFSACGTVSSKQIITIAPTPGSGTITGASGLCPGSMVSLSDAVPGGTWTTSNTTVATISSSGVVTAVGVGVDTVYYTVVSSCGSSVSTGTVTVANAPVVAAITGSVTTMCVGTTIYLSDVTPGGVWSASNGNATVSGGAVHGVGAGPDIISYTVTNSCGSSSAVMTVSVVIFPSVTLISGPSSVCTGSVISLSDATPGGVWSSTNTSVATVTGSGLVTGASAGTDIITYLITNACGTVGTSQNITVYPVANAGSISGGDSLCVGTTITLSDAAPGGVWSAGNAHATVSGGVVTGVSAGTVPISYSVTNGCGTVSAVKIVTVVTPANPGVITGPGNVCIGSGITLADTASGGTWLSSNITGTIVAPGIVDGVSVGIDTIYYLVNNACGAAVASHVVNVNPVPAVTAISGPTHQCAGTVISLSDATTGGQWYSSNPADAAVDLISGMTTGTGAGIVNITYTVTNGFGCPASAYYPDTVFVIPVSMPIAGIGAVCAGSATTLSNSVASGVWSSDNTTVATVDPVSGVLHGVAAGSANIYYSITNICGSSVTSAAETVNPLPAITAISGPTNVCVGSVVNLSDATAGGVWSSGNTSVAVVSATGAVTGAATGGANIIYTVTSPLGCSASAIVVEAVNPYPVVPAISGAGSVCIGGSAALSDALAGGAWTSSNTSVATIDAATGAVYGVVSGGVTVTYTVTNAAGCSAATTAGVSVGTVPPHTPISGVGHVCVGSTTALSNALAGGVWSTVIGNAMISGSGVATGVTAGTEYVIYTVSNVCGSRADTALITVHALPVVASITGASTTACAGMAITLTDATPGGIWSSSNTTVATVNSTGLVSSISVGTATIEYTVTNTYGCSASVIIGVTVSPALPAAVITPSGTATLCHGSSVFLDVIPSVGLAYQWYINGVLIPGATTAGYTANIPGSYTAMVSNGVCSETTAATTVFASPVPVIQFDAPNILYTSSYTSYQWYLNGVPIAGDTTGLIYESTPGNYMVVVTDVNGCSDTSSVYTVASLGIANPNAGSDIKIYPNPASSVLHIDAAVQVNVTVYSVDGKELISQKGVHDLDIRNLANGMYIVMIYDTNNVLLKTAKFAKTE